MTPEDVKTLHAELCKRWKGKFNRSDLDYWARELDGYAIIEVVEAFTKFRNSSRFVPKVAEIVKLLPRRAGDVSTSGNEGTHADVLRRQNRQYVGRSDAEVYVRYHRSLWISYGRNLDAFKTKITRECVTDLVLSGMPEAEAKRSASFVFDSPEMFRLLLNELRDAGTTDLSASESTEHVFT